MHIEEKKKLQKIDKNNLEEPLDLSPLSHLMFVTINYSIKYVRCG